MEYYTNEELLELLRSYLKHRYYIFYRVRCKQIIKILRERKNALF